MIDPELKDLCFRAAAVFCTYVLLTYVWRLPLLLSGIGN